MRKHIIPLLLIASLGASSVAMAAPSDTEGTIKSISGKAWTVSLMDGSVYHLPKGFKLADLKIGEKVKVTWDKVGKVNEASAIIAG